jgi:hypothetical protein
LDSADQRTNVAGRFGGDKDWEVKRDKSLAISAQEMVTFIAFSEEERSMSRRKSFPKLGKIVVISILLKNSHSKNQEKIFRSQKLCNARSELG